MSEKYPIIAVTGASGAGSPTVKAAFNHIFYRHNAIPLRLDGDSFHRYNRREMLAAESEARKGDRVLSHVGPDANLFEQQARLFEQFAATGTGKRRFYLHTVEAAQPFGQEPGTFTPWEDIPEGTDALLYTGLHGGVVADGIDMARHVDLLIGVAPIINLEWIQKIHRDIGERGYKAEDVTETILRRMSDYVHYITPQFSRTDINFQRIPTVDTSNPFAATEVPTLKESHVVIRFRDPVKFKVDFPYLLEMIHDSFMSRRNTIVVPGGALELAMELVLTPIVGEMLERRRTLL